MGEWFPYVMVALYVLVVVSQEIRVHRMKTAMDKWKIAANSWEITSGTWEAQSKYHQKVSKQRQDSLDKLGNLRAAGFRSGIFVIYARKGTGPPRERPSVRP